MKLVSYTVCHYTGSYLPYALESIAPFVEKSGIFYTSNPSHNHTTNLKCPETKQDILESIQHLDNVEFVDSSGFRMEGQHRDFAVAYMKEKYNPDFIMVVDSDEIWPQDTLSKVIEFLESTEPRRNWLINFSHLWRSFNYIIKDNMWPVRFIDCRLDDDSIGYIPQELGNIFHMGYCVTNDIMFYKMAIHGHKNELRDNWYNEKWLTVAMNDVHPTCEDTWYPESFDKSKLPELMHNHPYYDLELIE